MEEHYHKCLNIGFACGAIVGFGVASLIFGSLMLYMTTT